MTAESWSHRCFVALLGVVMACLLFSPETGAASDLVFGPQTCQRGSGAPTVLNYTFAVTEPSRGYIFKVYNGGLEDTTYDLVSSSTITLNGVEVLGPNNFSQNVSYLEVPISLQNQNTLAVEVRGKPGGAIILKVFPFVVLDTPAKGQVFNTQPISVSGHLYASTTSVSVNGRAASISGTNFTVSDFSLAEGGNIITATAVGGGGLTGTNSREVILDSSAPSISISYPSDGLVTNQDVTPQYMVSDALDQNPAVSVSPQPPYRSEGLFQMTVTATDWAGNQSQVTRNFTVDKTAPVIGSLLPAPDALLAEAMPPISASWSDALSGLDLATARLTLDGAAMSAQVSPAGISYQPSVSLSGGLHQVSLTIKDRAGNEGSAQWGFSIDATPPEISISSPANALITNQDVALTYTVHDNLDQNPTVVVTPLPPYTAEGSYHVVITATDQAGNQAQSTRDFVIDKTPLVITVTSPVDGFTVLTPNIDVAGTIDDPEADVTVNGMAVEVSSGDFVAREVSLSPGPNTIAVSAVDLAGNATTVDFNVTFTPAPVGSVRIWASPATIRPGETATLAWESTDTSVHAINQSIGLVQPSGSLMVAPTATTEYVITGIGADGASKASVTIQVIGDVAPQAPGSFGAQYQDLVPEDATLPALDPLRFALVTGLVQDPEGRPIPGIYVSIHDHPEYGHVVSNDVGRFTIPVEGGVALTVSFRKEGLLPADRQVDVARNEIGIAETVTMIAKDVAATRVFFDGNATSATLHESSVVSDDRGSRSARLVFFGDNMAYAQVEDEEIPLSTLNVRATEFRTPSAMPAKLPSSSGFTYCVDLSVDGASEVRFSKPVIAYVDNFLEFPVGMAVPVGRYDYKQGAWVPSDNGVVIRLLDTDGDGRIDALDATGDGNADDLDGDGQTTDEVLGIAQSSGVAANATYWKVSISHFSPWDCNWPFGPPAGSIPPNSTYRPSVDQQKTEELKINDTLCTNSYIEQQSRIYHEDIPITGTELSLHYASNRVPGYRTKIHVPVSGATVPPIVKRMIAKIEIAGRTHEETFDPLPMTSYDFQWDGRDFLGRAVGSQYAKINIGFVYDGVYTSPAASDQSFAAPGTYVTGVRSREEVTIWKSTSLKVTSLGWLGNIAEGWTISSHHQLQATDTASVYYGDGRMSAPYRAVITTIAGDGSSGAAIPDGGPAIAGKLGSVSRLDVDIAGNVYFVENGRVRKIDLNGIVTTLPGLNDVRAVAVSKHRELYVAHSGGYPQMSWVSKVDALGHISRLAGIGPSGFSGDDGPAVSAQINDPSGITIDEEGNVYIAERGNGRVRKVDSSGVIRTVAGSGRVDRCADFGLAGLATQYGLSPVDVAISSTGELYVLSQGCDGWGRSISRVRKVDSSGNISTVAGGACSSGGDWSHWTLEFCLGSDAYGLEVDRENIY